MKIVIDTNLLIASYFNKQSSSHKILGLVKKGELEMPWTNQIKDEADFILGNILRSMKKSKKEKQQILDEIFNPKDEVKDPPKVDIIKEDPSDNKFLACAQKAKADYIISNDSDLLTVKEYKGVQILTPSEFLRAINKK